MEDEVTATTPPMPLLLVHGWAGSADSWQPIIERADARVWSPIHSVRLPGSPGASSTAPGTIGSATDRVVNLLKGLDAPALIVGHSMGAQVSLLAHATVPELVAGEVVIDPAYNADNAELPALQEWADRIARDGHAAVVTFFEEAVTRLGPADVAQIIADLERTESAVIESYLRTEYLTPMSIGIRERSLLAATGRRSPVLSVHSSPVAAELARSLPAPADSRVVEWSGFGHYLHLEDPDRFVALLDEWRENLLGHALAGTP